MKEFIKYTAVSKVSQLLNQVHLQTIRNTTADIRNAINKKIYNRSYNFAGIIARQVLNEVEGGSP